MATSVSSLHQEEASSALHACAHCHAPYRQPKLLACLHSFCSQCLQGLTDSTGGGAASIITCPVCSHVTALSSLGVRSLTDNAFLQRVSEAHASGVKPTPTRDQSAVKLSLFRQELDLHRFSNMTDEQKFISVGKQPGDQTSVGANTQTQQDAVQNMARLHAKTAGLQGEALKVTCAIDRVNQHRVEWLKHREDVRRAIQRRASQFVSAVKKVERELTARLDDQAVEDLLGESLEKGKLDLKADLKQVLHQVSLMKGVREMGTPEEINQLASALLGPSVGIERVGVAKVNYELDLPAKAVDEMVSVGFGDLIATSSERIVYEPELKDYTTLTAEEIDKEKQSSQAFAFSAVDVVSTISGDQRPKVSPYRRSSSVTVRQLTRSGSDAGSKAVLEEFQNARESLRSRRQEILQGKIALSSIPNAGTANERMSRPLTRRGQSVDRNKNDGMKSQTVANESVNVADKSFTFSVPTSDTEVLQSITSTTLSSAAEEENMTRSVKSDTVAASKIESEKPLSHELLQAKGTGTNSSSSSTSSSRRVSFDHSPSMSPTLEDPLSGSRERHLRRAITSAADKKSKMDYLRDNWQKRKEILIQSKGFVSSEENEVKTDSQVVKTLTSEALATDSVSRPENGAFTPIPLASRGVGSPPLRSKFTSATRSQLEQKKYQGTKDSSNDDHNTSSVSDDAKWPVKMSEIPASVVMGEIQRMERERLPSASEVLNSRDDETVAIGSGKEQSPKSDEEEVVVMETITIPVTDKMREEMATTPTPNSEVSSVVVQNNQTSDANKKTLESKTTAWRGLTEAQRTVLPISPSSSINYSNYSKPEQSSTEIKTLTNETPKANPESSTSSIDTTRPTTSRYTSAAMQQSSRLYSSPYTSQITSQPQSNANAAVTTVAKDNASTTNNTSVSSATAEVTASPSSSTPSTSSSFYSGRYSRRYVPKVEVDIESLFKNFYKPAPSVSRTETSNGGTDSKSSTTITEKQDSSSKNTASDSSGISSTQSRVDSSTPLNTRSSLKKDDISTNGALQQNQMTDQSSFSSITTRFSLSDTSNQTNSANNTNISKPRVTFANDSLNTQTENSGPSLSSTDTYSRFYSRAKDPYSVPAPENIDSKPEEIGGAATHDQKVNETFTEAGSSRRRYDPASKRSARSRRHTVEVSKTIPAGMRISDLYKGPVSEVPKRVNEDIIEESGTEPEIVTTKPPVSRLETVQHSRPTNTLGEVVSSAPKLDATGGELRSPGDTSLTSRLQFTLSSWPKTSSQLSPRDNPATAPTPLASPLTEEKSLECEGDDPSKTEKNLKDIARKKRERWRRLTVY